jgi:hypothetical protein
MIDTAMRAQACRVFEDTLRRFSAVLTEPATLACTLPGDEGIPVIVAQYRVYPDGTFEQVESHDSSPA